ncbi:Bug family tripartite tricarboxylate transporter substrate binding protein [Pararoseomonas indoligenes]|uniref:Tripartite tricarboxylate transporter substrate binding protein n=1 Tax=Roseomonas indoligenes TaxID=2820811 RepID=A0A940MZZ7_9PROT|nr:tripartite tricarboxylate transporter substrate binding protein [Pararoseomonas indoligenes]MBP0494175.1 tripartite tricarboxylate transporter substrate binding protein [Pararoseomonas indoligenes]
MTMSTASRRSLLLAAPALTLSGRAARAQEGGWPDRPVRVILPWPPGGTADIVGRLFFASLSQATGKPFVIENRPGATGTIGAAAFAQSAPDGYTVMHGSTGLSVEGALFSNLPYDAARDFIPVFRTITVPQLVLVPAGLPVRTAAELVAYAKEKRGINGASAGIGSIQHLSMELFARQTGAPINHIPYRGGAPIYTDLMTGTVDLYFGNANAPTGFVREGKLRALAHTGKGRLSSLPEVPPLSDLLPGFETYEWNGVFLPKGTPPALVARLNALLNEALDRPEVAEKLRAQDLLAEHNTPDEFAAFFGTQSRRWQGFVREAGIRLE